MKHNSFAPFISCLFVLLVVAGTKAEPLKILTRAEAFELLSTQGVRWKQTELLVKEAEALRGQADSANRFHAAFVARQIATRANLRQYGFADPGPMDIISFGGAVVAFEYSVWDPRSRARSDAAATNETLNKEVARQYQNDLTYAMLLSYVNSQRFAEKLKVIDQSIERNQEILKMAESKVKSGAGIALDVARAKGLVAYESMKRADTETGYKKSLRDLATLLGVEKVEAVEEMHPSSIAIDTTKTDVKSVLAARPDVKSADLTVQAARQLKKEAEGEAGAKVSLLGEAGIGNSNIMQSESASMIGSVGIQVKVPIYDGGYFGAKKQQAQVNVEKASLQSRHVQLDGESQLNSSIEQMEMSKKALELAGEQVRLANEEMNLARARFKSGASSGVDLANSQANLSNALNNKIDIVAAHEAAKMTYFRNIGDFSFYFAALKSPQTK